MSINWPQNYKEMPIQKKLF